MDKAFYIHIITITIAAIFAGLSQKFALKDENGKIKHLNRIFITLSFLTLFITMGFRTVGVGVDDNTYNRIFRQIISNGPLITFLNTTMEPGYIYLNYFFSFFTHNFQYALIIITFVPLLLYYKALDYEKNNINLFLAFFLFGTILYLYFYGIIRLFIAASIIAYSFRYVNEKSTFKFVLCVSIAALFHYSAVFMLFLLYFTTEKEDKPRNMKSLIMLVSIGMPLLIYIISNFIFPNMGDRYNAYTQVKTFKFSDNLINKLPILIAALFLYKDISKINPNIKIHITCYALVIIIAIYGSLINIGRIQWYLMFSTCVILPSMVRVFNKSKYSKFNIILIPLILIYGVMYMNSIYNQTTNTCMHNYSNILFK